VTIISVDLASRDYRDIGLVAIERTAAAIVVTPIDLGSSELRGRPDPAALAHFLTGLAQERGASAIGLDGPQGWKDVNNGCKYSRVCEAKLRTQGKTGLPGNTKPGNYLGFIKFSIATFDELDRRGWPRLGTLGLRGDPVALETFPTAAWRAVGLPSLPGKGTARAEQVRAWTDRLLGLANIRIAEPLSHDGLQATISGLGVLALAEGSTESCEAIGRPPFEDGGLWFEGYIVNPRRDESTPEERTGAKSGKRGPAWSSRPTS